MPLPKLGVVLHDELALRAARADDPVDLVVLRTTLLNPPRAAAASKLAAHIHELHPDAEIIPYVWHLVSHGPSDGLRGMATRTLPGEPRRYGLLQDTPEVREAWTITKLCAEALGATDLILRTPASFTPSKAHRDRLHAFVEARAAESFGLIWEAEGLWEPPETLAIARELDIATVIPAFDGTGRPFSKTLERRWLRVDGAGPTTRLRPILAEGLLASVEENSPEEDAPVILFAGPNGYANLRAFAAYVIGEGDEGLAS
ncbi:MAG: hypothetical protein IPK80_08765 [Nannocystis sp.]|nr:hypothetical protein [Nannocystis sp.]